MEQLIALCNMPTLRTICKDLELPTPKHATKNELVHLIYECMTHDSLYIRWTEEDLRELRKHFPGIKKIEEKNQK